MSLKNFFKNFGPYFNLVSFAVTYRNSTEVQKLKNIKFDFLHTSAQVIKTKICKRLLRDILKSK
jgi:hypothetical protein